MLDQAVRGRATRRAVRGYGILGTVAGIFLTGGMVWYGAGLGLYKNWVIPLLSIPVTFVLWSPIGSFAAMLYRFNKSSDVEMEFPLRWLATRPVTGMVMGLIVYLIIKGVLIVSGSTIPFSTLGSQELIWLVAFFAGFSDRFCEAVLNLIVGRLGAAATDGPGSAVAPRRSAGHQPSHRTFEVLEELSWARRQSADAVTGEGPMPPPAPRAKNGGAAPEPKNGKGA